MKLKFTNLFLIIFCFPFFFGCSNSNQVPLSERKCAFCDQKVLDKQAFYEDDLVIGLLTHKPAFPGHALIIPKRHVKRFEDLTEAEFLSVCRLIKKAHRVISKVYGTSEYVILQKNGEVVGQSVPHVHFHYIPQKAGTGCPATFFLTYILSSLKSPQSPEVTAQQISKIKNEFVTLNLTAS